MHKNYALILNSGIPTNSAIPTTPPFAYTFVGDGHQTATLVWAPEV